jgi:hypothetical protein
MVAELQVRQQLQILLHLNPQYQARLLRPLLKWVMHLL